MRFLCVVYVEQNRPSRSNSALQRSFSSPRATVTNGNDRSPSYVFRNASLRETLSRPAASWLCTRQTSSASSSPSSTRRRDVTVGCLATTQVTVTCRTSTAATLAASTAGRSSMLPTATHCTVRPVNRDKPLKRDHSPTTTGVQQRLKVIQHC